MKRIIQFQINEEESVYVEVENQSIEGVGIAPASPNDETIVERAQQSFSDALSKVRPAVEIVVRTLESLRSDEVEVEFGLKLSAEAGVLFASGSAEANYVVKLKWNNAAKIRTQEGR